MMQKLMTVWENPIVKRCGLFVLAFTLILLAFLVAALHVAGCIILLMWMGLSFEWASACVLPITLAIIGGAWAAGKYSKD
jgi:hypothetical protein